MDNQLAVRGNNDIANVQPETAWLYSGGGMRLSIDNKHRDGFVINSTEETVKDLVAQIVTVTSLHSHRQPDEKRGGAKHAEANEWCESKTNKMDEKCNGCPAFDECKWKIELELSVVERDGVYLLTIPTVSAMRFKDAVSKLGRIHKKHFTQVVWRMTVEVEQKDGNTFPVIKFEPFDVEDGSPFDLTGGTPKASPKSSVSINVKGQQWVAFCAGVAAEESYYATKDGLADTFHIVGALSKLGIKEVNAADFDSLKAQLKDYAKASKEAKKK